jgi:CBS domain-containing protein
MICPRCGQNNLPGSDTCRHCECDLTALDRPEPLDRVERSLMADTVAMLQPRAPAVVGPGATVASALRVLLDEDVGALLVVDAGGRLAGIFSERDLLTKVVGTAKPLDQLPVEAFMTPRPESVAAGDSLAFALHKMDVGGYRHLPVVADGKPVGILSVRDLIRHLTGICSERGTRNAERGTIG